MKINISQQNNGKQNGWNYNVTDYQQELEKELEANLNSGNPVPELHINMQGYQVDGFPGENSEQDPTGNFSGSWTYLQNPKQILLKSGIIQDPKQDILSFYTILCTDTHFM